MALPEKSAPSRRLGTILLDNGIYLALVLLCLGIYISEIYILGSKESAFIKPENIINVARQISFNTIIAVGMTFVILTGGIDLSVGSLVALVSVIVSYLICVEQLSVPLAIMAGLIAGGGIGAFSGFFITKFNVPPFIATLAVMTSAKGAAFLITGGNTISGLPDSFTYLGKGLIGPVPVPVIIMLGVILIAWFILIKTPFGRYVYAVGGNREAARLSGVNDKFVIWSVYVIVGVLTALSAILMTGRISSGDPKIGTMWELDAIAAVVVGGTSLFGGRGSVIGTLVGALIIGVLNNGLNLLDVSTYYQMVIKGGVILGAVLLDQLKAKK